jgi:DNA-binding SARP family transcriptional activator
VRYEILGPLQVLDGDVPVPLGRPKQRAVLAILLLDAGRVVSLDRLVDEVWGREAPPQALASVQAYVSHLRRLLEPGRASGAPARVLVNQPPGYRLVVGPDDLDMARFQALTEQGHAALAAGDPQRAADVLAEGLRLWRGPVLADFADAPFVQPERTRLEELRLSALEERITADLALGRHGLVAAELEQLTAEHPFRERLVGLRVVALYRCGRQAEALQAHQRFSSALREELGLDPGPELRALERDVLRQAPELDWTPAGGGLRGPARVAPAPGPEPAVSDGLVGRDRQLRAVDQALERAHAGRGAALLVSGEPGIGKTRLAEEAVRRARAGGAVAAWGRSDENDGAPPLWPWAQILRTLSTAAPSALEPYVPELVPILPELGSDAPVPPAPVLDLEASRFRLYRAVIGALRALAADRPLLLVLDDLQWADVASQRLLGLLAGSLDDARVVVLVTYRDRAPDAALTDTLAELARAPVPVERLELGGLTRDDVASLMARRFAAREDAELARVVADRTAGNPFFVLEVLRLLGAAGWPARAPDDLRTLVAQQVPAGVRDVLRRRLARLPDQTRTVLLLAAVAGAEFDLDLVEAVAGIGEDEAVDALELALLSGLVVEDPERVGRFRFAHALVREAIYGEIARVRRARLHARVAQALLRRGTPEPGGDVEHALQLAHHWWLAAPVVGAGQAVPHVMAAADLCLEALAHEEAERQLRRSLDLLAETPTSRGRDAAELAVRLRLGTLLVHLRGTAVEEAWTSFDRARELAEGIGDPSSLQAAYRSLYEVLFARADHRTAAALAQLMLDLAEQRRDPGLMAVSRLSMGRTLWCQGRFAAAREHLEAGLRAADGHDLRGDPLPPTITLHLQLAAALDPLGETARAAALVEAAVTAAREAPPFARSAVLTSAALMAGLRRDLAAARGYATEAAELAERWNFPAPARNSAAVLAWLAALDGDPEAVGRLRDHIEVLEAGGVQHLVAWGIGLLAEANLRHGRPEEALRLLDDALARVERTGECAYESELHRLRATALLALTPSRAPEGRRAVDRAVEVARAQGAVLFEERARRTAETIGAVRTGS